MPKRSKESRADTAKSSTARSRKLYSAYLDDDLRTELRSWPKANRRKVGSLIRRVQESFGKPHLPFRNRGSRSFTKRQSLACLRVSRRLGVAIGFHVRKAFAALFSHDRH